MKGFTTTKQELTAKAVELGYKSFKQYLKDVRAFFTYDRFEDREHKCNEWVIVPVWFFDEKEREHLIEYFFSADGTCLYYRDEDDDKIYYIVDKEVKQ